MGGGERRNATVPREHPLDLPTPVERAPGENSVTPPRHADGVSALDQPLRLLGVPAPLGPEDVIADWNCPVCGTHTPRTYRPGRPPVYCTNACRQKAYRYRRDHGI